MKQLVSSILASDEKYSKECTDSAKALIKTLIDADAKDANAKSVWDYLHHKLPLWVPALPS
jgi:hypothetical protein